MMAEFIDGFCGIWAMWADIWPGWDAHSLGTVAGCLSIGVLGGLAFRGLFWWSDRRIERNLRRARGPQ